MQNQSKSKGILLAPFLRSRTGSCHLRSTRWIIKRSVWNWLVWSPKKVNWLTLYCFQLRKNKRLLFYSFHWARYRYRKGQDWYSLYCL